MPKAKTNPIIFRRAINKFQERKLLTFMPIVLKALKCKYSYKHVHRKELSILCIAHFIPIYIIDVVEQQCVCTLLLFEGHL